MAFNPNAFDIGAFSAPVISDATFLQGVGPQAVYDNGEVVTDSGEVVTFDDAGGWLALSTAKTAAVGAWAQDATWDASASATEDTGPITGSATFDQSATWDAIATTPIPPSTGGGPGRRSRPIRTRLTAPKAPSPRNEDAEFILLF